MKPSKVHPNQLCLIPLTHDEWQEKAKCYSDEQMGQRKAKPEYKLITVGDAKTFVFAHYKTLGRKKNHEGYSYLVAGFDEKELAIAVKERLNQIAQAVSASTAYGGQGMGTLFHERGGKE